MAKTSEFGRGLGYNLGLFLAHEGRLHQWLTDYRKLRERKDAGNYFKDEDAVSLWFNGAGDHFFDMEVEYAPKHLRGRFRRLRENVLGWRLSYDTPEPTLENAQWAIQESKDLLRLLDRAHKIPTIKGQWE